MQPRTTPERLYTVAEWEKLPENPRYELIDGQIVMMASPSWDHQTVCDELTRQFGNNLLNKRCTARSNINVRLSEATLRPTVFIPDLAVVCDRSKIRPNGIVGTPDLIIEILSPSTAGVDKITKLNRYRKAGVLEYWIVDPSNQVVDVFQWENGSPAQPQAYTRENTIKVGVLEDCEIDLALVFPEKEDDPNN